ncbi:MAG: hypothetical protein CMH69_04025 [Nitratireductor sp.]|nr:hypothetical protein [Nitratireductor sp.]
MRFILVFFSFFIALSATAQEQTVSPLAPLDTSSPRATYYSFIEIAEEVEQTYLDYRARKSARGADQLFDSFARAARALDMSAIPEAQRAEVASLRVAQLVDILMRLPSVAAEQIPGGTEDLPAGWTIPGTEMEIVRQEEGARAGEFLFSAATVERLPEFHERIIALPPLHHSAYDNWTDEVRSFTGPFFPYGFINALPDVLMKPFLGTQLWKALLTAAVWIGIGVITIGWGILMRGVETGHRSIGGLLRSITVPLLLGGMVWGAHYFAGYQTGLAGFFATMEIVVTTVLLYFALAWLVLLVCHLVVELIIALPAIPDQSYDANLLRLVARVGGLAAAGAVLVYGADKIGIPALGLIAGVGVGGVALALAAQSTVENLFGGVSLFADRPFRIGDYIQYGASSGTVEAIGPRSARIRGLDGTLATVPNSDLAKMHIVNFSLRNKCLFRHVLGLRYETSRLQLMWILEEMRKTIAAHPMVETGSGTPRIRLIGFGSSSIDVEVRATVMTPDFGQFLEVQEELLLELQEVIAKGGSGFAFPSQTVYLSRDSSLDDRVQKKIEAEAREKFQSRRDGEAVSLSGSE